LALYPKAEQAVTYNFLWRFLTFQSKLMMGLNASGCSLSFTFCKGMLNMSVVAQTKTVKTAAKHDLLTFMLQFFEVQ